MAISSAYSTWSTPNTDGWMVNPSCNEQSVRKNLSRDFACDTNMAGNILMLWVQAFLYVFVTTELIAPLYMTELQAE